MFGDKAHGIFKPIPTRKEEGFSADEDEDLSTLPIGLQLGFILEPIQLQTLAERHARAMQHHP